MRPELVVFLDGSIHPAFEVEAVRGEGVKTENAGSFLGIAAYGDCNTFKKNCFFSCDDSGVLLMSYLLQ
jgi:hypothetical protein